VCQLGYLNWQLKPVRLDAFFSAIYADANSEAISLHQSHITKIAPD
jgi:hypothetical protein